MSQETQYISARVEELTAAMRTDLNTLAQVVIPEVYQFPYPPILLAVWDWLISQNVQRTFPKLGLGLPRGFAKTTLMKLFVIWLILFSDRRFILVVSATAEHANNFLADVKDILSHDNIRTIFGDWEAFAEKNTENYTKFTFRGRNIILKGIGTGGTARGLNVKHQRPDVIILEDAQTREDANSEKLSKDLYTWILGTLGKAKSPFGTMMLFVANMYPTPHSILKKINKDPNWIKFIAAGLQSDLTSLWEDLQPAEQLIAEYKADRDAGHPEIFAAEVLNDESAVTNKLIDLDKLPPYPYTDNDVAIYKFVIIDPAGKKKRSDATAIGYFECIESAKPILCDLRSYVMSPGEQVKNAIEFAMEHGCYAIGVESVAYQASLLFWIEHFINELGITGIKFFEVPSGRLSKEDGIIEWFRIYRAGEAYVHPRVKAQVHAQISSFDHTRKDNVDDILDVCKMAPKLIEIAGGDLMPPQILSATETPGILILDGVS